MSIKKKIISAFSVLIAIIILIGAYNAYNLESIKINIKNLTHKDFAGIGYLLEADRDSYQSNVVLSQLINLGLTFLLEADRDSYQSNAALTQLISLKDEKNTEKLINDGVINNLNQVRQRFDKFRSLLEKELSHDKEKFEEFDRLYAKTAKDTQELIKLIRNKEFEKANVLYFTSYLGDYEKMRDTMDFFTEETYTVIENNQEDTDTIITTSLTIFAIMTVLSIIIAVVFTIYLSRNINNTITAFKDGLLGFFSYLNKESSSVNLLDDKANDEIAQIAKIVNKNITNTKSLLEKDETLIADVKRVVELVKSGKLDQKINLSTQNKSLEELKQIFNEMLQVISENISNDLNEIKTALEHFQKLNFRYRISKASGNTVQGLNTLANIINEMLVENKSNGLTLQDSANSLLSNVDVLSKASNEAAASLEETAAALEEITANITHNTENVVKMATNANELKKSATDGEALASKTTNAMDDINEQVTSINEAITVIDQIAFQTNILSLNAAVEAATAGEAGKGFAVVAQEVRNLAARSAEAAKEIKELVENATVKANDGKQIADKMIQGYVGLNENVSKTLELINDVENASKEQQSGITQINDAVNLLDRQTQQNASVASQTHSVASQTQTIAEDIVRDADEKEFEGKENVKTKDIKVKESSTPASNPIQNKKEVKTTPPSSQEPSKEETTKEITANNNHDNDEWESF